MVDIRVVMGHPTLNANVRAAAAALAEADMLAEFHTLLDTSTLASKTPGRVSAQLARRELPDSVRPLAHSHPVVEIARLLTRKVARSRRLDKRLVDLAYARLDSALARAIGPDVTAVYAYEDGARRAFARAEQLDVYRIYDLPIGYWRSACAILTEEADLKPDWAETLTGLGDVSRKLARKDEELAAADTVFVASSFTKDTITAFPGAVRDVRVIPYGAPPPTRRPRPRDGKPVRVLFVGGLSQRKGLSYFFEALDMVDVQVNVVVIGMKSGESAQLRRELERPNLTWYPSLTHRRVLEIMSESDVLVFPSLFEGFGLVITEALSQGVPVITTRNTAGPDLLTEGVDGWIVPIRSASAIAERICELADIERRCAMSAAAMETARKHPWESYSQSLVAAVRDCM